VTINTTKTRQKNMKTGVMILSQYFLSNKSSRNFFQQHLKILPKPIMTRDKTVIKKSLF